MPYNEIHDLPENIRNILPPHAQDIYREAFNNAFKEYKDPDKRYKGGSKEEVAHRVAWSAVKKKYHKKNNKWVEK